MHVFVCRFSGIFHFTTPVLFVTDLDLIKKICVKDFDHFIDHNTQINSDVDKLLSKNLILLKGEEWRDMRATLSPAFTSSKMRGMFHLIDDCTKDFLNYLTEQLTKNDTIEIEMKDTSSRFATDVIASVAFGINCNSLSCRDNEFFMMGQAITNNSALVMIKFILISASKTLTKVRINLTKPL